MILIRYKVSQQHKSFLIFSLEKSPWGKGSSEWSTCQLDGQTLWIIFPPRPIPLCKPSHVIIFHIVSPSPSLWPTTSAQVQSPPVRTDEWPAFHSSFPYIPHSPDSDSQDPFWDYFLPIQSQELGPAPTWAEFYYWDTEQISLWRRFLWLN